MAQTTYQIQVIKGNTVTQVIEIEASSFEVACAKAHKDGWKVLGPYGKNMNEGVPPVRSKAGSSNTVFFGVFRALLAFAGVVVIVIAVWRFAGGIGGPTFTP